VVDEAKARGQAGVVEGANEVVASFLTFHWSGIGSVPAL